MISASLLLRKGGVWSWSSSYHFQKEGGSPTHDFRSIPPMNSPSPNPIQVFRVWKSFPRFFNLALPTMTSEAAHPCKHLEVLVLRQGIHRSRQALAHRLRFRNREDLSGIVAWTVHGWDASEVMGGRATFLLEVV